MRSSPRPRRRSRSRTGGERRLLLLVRGDPAEPHAEGDEIGAHGRSALRPDPPGRAISRRLMAVGVGRRERRLADAAQAMQRRDGDPALARVAPRRSRRARRRGRGNARARLIGMLETAKLPLERPGVWLVRQATAMAQPPLRQERAPACVGFFAELQDKRLVCARAVSFARTVEIATLEGARVTSAVRNYRQNIGSEKFESLANRRCPLHRLDAPKAE